jgi:type II secretory pathway component PulF
MRDKLISSLIYPVIVLFLAVFSVLIIITIITPRVSEMFSQLGNTVPASVVGILQFSQIAFRGLLLFLGVLIAAAVLVHLRAKRNKRFAEVLDRIKLKFPVIGPFIFENEMLTILFTLEALTENAIPVEDALREATASTSNKALSAALLSMRDKLLSGKGLALAMEEEEIIPEKVARWVGIGERTGKVQQVFSQLRSFYEKELNKKVSRFMSLIEPALIIFVGLIVFGIVIFVIVPIFSTFGSLLE